MSDMRIVYDPATQSFDYEMCHGALDLSDYLLNAVWVSLFSDARALDDDVIPDGSAQQRGWWGDQFLLDDGQSLGSRRWLLSREKQLDSVLRDLEEYDSEALQWLVDEGIASRIEVVCSNGELRGWLIETIRIYRTTQDNSPWEFAWKEQLNPQRCEDKFEQSPVIVVYPPIDENSISLGLHSYASLINALSLGASGLAFTQLALHSYAVLRQALQIGDVALQPVSIGVDSYNALIAGAALGDEALQPATGNIHSYNAFIQGVAVGNAALNQSSLIIDSYSTLIGAA